MSSCKFILEFKKTLILNKGIWIIYIYLLSQWLNLKLFGITYLVGKIKFKLFFQGPLGLSEYRAPSVFYCKTPSHLLTKLKSSPSSRSAVEPVSRDRRCFFFAWLQCVHRAEKQTSKIFHRAFCGDEFLSLEKITRLIRHTHTHTNYINIITGCCFFSFVGDVYGCFLK